MVRGPGDALSPIGLTAPRIAIRTWEKSTRDPP